MKLTGTKDGCKNYYSKEMIIGSKEAIVSIIKFNNINEPVEVHYNYKDATIIDNNYTWIQIAIKNTNFWIKSMFDQNNKMVETYIDVTRNNYFDDLSNPEYEDLFLDIVIPYKGHIYQMDDVELMKALTEGLITDGEYKLSKIVSRNLRNFLDKNHQEFLDFINNLKKELEIDLENKGKII
ncbi:MAG: DUF402 domain-containing protein [Bacilli bacterium]|nr:DUF402 domain-containing protein [Bacilli bacterium]